MIAALLLLATHSGTPVHACGAYLPEYDEQAGLLASMNAQAQPNSEKVAANPEEKHLVNVRQLTFGGQNAEAYWSVDGKKITYQTRQAGYPDEQIFTMNADGSNKTLMSTGKGRCTCSYFTPDGKWLYFSSTHERNEGAQKPVDMSKGYVWMVNPDFAIYRRSTDPKKNAIEPVIKKDGAYLAETTIAPNGKYITFTSDFEGDLEIYRADPDGKNIVRLTDHVGYDGGPFVSWDSKKIVYRADTIATDKDRDDYKALLKEHLVRPSKLEIFIMDADGKNKRQVTNLGCASFAPFLSPDGKRIIFSSNYGDPKGREFDLWMINIDGTGLERITHTPEFDGFPMFTKDGKRLIWGSNRFGKVKGETNLFVADWKN
ncbi:MAG: PD40 domain-containing protein [Armatimonadetes bacterium]|nr:PD40 domain-containing protein [Armatimonadota bacterium]